MNLRWLVKGRKKTLQYSEFVWTPKSKVRAGKIIWIDIPIVKRKPKK